MASAISSENDFLVELGKNHSASGRAGNFSFALWRRKPSCAKSDDSEIARRVVSQFEPSQEVFQRQTVVGGNFTKNGTQRSRLEWTMRWNGQMMLAAHLGGEPAMGTALASTLIAKRSPQRLLQIAGSQIARELHPKAKSSSNTR